MQNTRNSHFTRLTAAGLAVSLVGLSLTPLAHAQAADTGASKPAPAAAAAPEAQPVSKPKPPDKKTRDAARKSYSQGEKAFASGDFVGAQAGFETANSLIPSPHAEYWLAKSLEAQPDKLEPAIAAYERFLANPEAAKAGEDKVADAQTRLEGLKAKLVGEVEIVTTPMGASVSIDGTPQAGTTPLIVKLAPGAHKVSVTLAEHEPKDLDIEVKGGEKSQQTIELVATPPPAPPPVAEPLPAPAPVAPPPPALEKRSMVPAFVTLGIAAAGAAVGTVFGLQALSAKSDFEDNPSTEAADDTERNALIADMAFGVAITLGVTGIVLLTSSDDAPAETASRPKAPPMKLELDTYAGRSGGGGKLRLTF